MRVGPDERRDSGVRNGVDEVLRAQVASRLPVNVTVCERPEVTPVEPARLVELLSLVLVVVGAVTLDKRTEFGRHSDLSAGANLLLVTCGGHFLFQELDRGPLLRREGRQRVGVLWVLDNFPL